MEDFSSIKHREQIPLIIDIPPYMMDHHTRGNAVLPAVEAMQIMASSVRERVPGADIFQMSGARFDRFVPLDLKEKKLELIHELCVMHDGSVRSALYTRSVLKNGMTRLKEHAAMTFGGAGLNTDTYPLDLCSGLPGMCFDISCDDLYRDLVPFGPAYHTLSDMLHVSEDGALGTLKNDGIASDMWILGSPFPLDGAFHAACAWAQRYCGIVGFPVGFSLRKILRPVKIESIYSCRIVPVDVSGKSLIFDIFIHDEEGIPCEAIQGIIMKDVSGGAVTPPQWVRRGFDRECFKNMSKHCDAFAVMERKTVRDFAHKALSPHEKDRYGALGPRRAEGFMAARLCCKKISRMLSGNDLRTGPAAITTIDREQVRPLCPVHGADDAYSCSVSHDRRFACAAAASRGRIGIDVEVMAERVLKGQRFYMTDDEKELVRKSGLDPVAASLRVWSIKECAAKALDIKLVEAWRTAEVVHIGDDKSRVRIREHKYNAWHDMVEEHLFTVMVME